MRRRPPAGAPRRRLALLGLAALAALVGGIVAGASGGGKSPKHVPALRPPRVALAHAKRLSLRRQIGEVLMISFQGPGVPPYVKYALRQGRAGGVILFGANAQSPAELRSVTRTLQRAGHGRVLIAVDQEGGPIRILRWAHPLAAESGEATPAAAAADARRAAADLRRAGVNVTLAPVADVGTPISVMRGRAFPGGVAQVGTTVAAVVRAYRRGRVAATLKHFPGLGEASRNTDDQPVTISSPAAAIADRDLPPFVAGVHAGAPLVMASHALYAGLDPRNIASQSPAILGGLLRKRIGFGGVVITDSMEASAVLKRSSLETAALRSLSAGADILLLTGPGSFPRVAAVLGVAARRSPKFRARVEQAAARVIALKASLGLGRPRR